LTTPTTPFIAVAAPDSLAGLKNRRALDAALGALRGCGQFQAMQR